MDYCGERMIQPVKKRENATVLRVEIAVSVVLFPLVYS
jgi:hypothetical protein